MNYWTIYAISAVLFFFVTLFYLLYVRKICLDPKYDNGQELSELVFKIKETFEPIMRTTSGPKLFFIILFTSIGMALLHPFAIVWDGLCWIKSKIS